MNIWHSIKNLFGTEPTRLNLTEPLDVKRAFQLSQVGVTGRAEIVGINRDNLDSWSRRNELVYACIEKIKQAAIDPTPVVEKMVSGEWQTIAGHPLSRLLSRPNSCEDGASFWGSWLASEHIFGEAYAEIERNAMGQPARLWLLNPLCMKPVAGKGKGGSPIKAYEYNINGYIVRLDAKDVLVRRNKDLTTPFFGISPLQVALGAVDMDTAQTDFVRAFFNNGGVPSGLLRFPNAVLTPELAEEARQRFTSKYARYGRGHGGVAVLDQNAEYQKVGATLGELESDSLRCQAEARICSVFGVPPILVGAYVGLLHVNQRASAETAQKDFWDNKMSPLFKSLRTFLTWNLLPEFADIVLIENEMVRVCWDMSNVMAMQEDVDKHQDRARKNFQAGAITLNEFRAAIGEKPDETNGDYYLRPSMAIPQTPEVALIEAEKMPVEPKQLGAGDVDGEIMDDEKKSAPTDHLRADLIKQAIAEVKADKATFALVPKAVKGLAQSEISEAVAEIQSKAMLIASALMLEELGAEEFALRFEAEMNK